MADSNAPAVNLVMQWADAAVKAPKFSEATNRGECFRDETHGVRLIQTGIDRFTVVYGKEVTPDLDYDRAALKLGGALMHSLACAGDLDNRERRSR